MGETGVEHMSAEDRAKLDDLRADMELARLALIDVKVAFDKACDAVYLFVRSHREQ